MTPSRLAVVFTALVAISAAAQDSATPVPHVSRTVPVSTGARALSAERTITAPDPEAQPRQAPPANSWKLLATLPGTIIHDLVFVSATVGYAAAEGGQVWKTTNGGKNWSMVLNLGYPYYFYGVAALSPKIIAVTGFLDTVTEPTGDSSLDAGWGRDLEQRHRHHDQQQLAAAHSLCQRQGRIDL